MHFASMGKELVKCGSQLSAEADRTRKWQRRQETGGTSCDKTLTVYALFLKLRWLELVGKSFIYSDTSFGRASCYSRLHGFSGFTCN